jgi:hypothetical protein
MPPHHRTTQFFSANRTEHTPSHIGYLNRAQNLTSLSSGGKNDFSLASELVHAQ